MNPFDERGLILNRRHFFGLCNLGLGTAALASLLSENGSAQQPLTTRSSEAGEPKIGLTGLPHFAPKAKRVIYLFQAGGPSQLDLFDPKPGLEKYRGQNLPESIRKGQRLTGMTASQSSLPTAPSKFSFAQHGQSGVWLSELLPQTAKVVDDLSFIKSMHTEQINHDPVSTRRPAESRGLGLVWTG